MIELIYRSTADINIKSSDILNTSKKYNSEYNITGCLLYYNHEFLQILEGEEADIKELFSKIKNDRRHSNLVNITENAKQERTFKNWSMAYHEFKKTEIHDLNKKHFINSFLTISELAEKPIHVIKLFWHLSQNILKS